MKILDYLFGRRESEIESLNGFRAVAILLVFLFHSHVCIEIFKIADNDFIFEMKKLHHGVTMFFVLSGFLISYGLYREYERNNSISLVSFFKSRSLRIFPAYYFFLTISWILTKAFLVAAEAQVKVNLASFSEIYEKLSNQFSNYPYELIYMSYYFPSTNLHTWPLAIEEKYYFLFPSILTI